MRPTPIVYENPLRGFGPFEQSVLEKWKSIKHVYTFLKREFERFNQACFSGSLTLPSFQIKLTRLSKRPLAEYLWAATYQPSHGEHPAEISLFPIALLDRYQTQIVLAHEMVHHWEWTHPSPEPSPNYPHEIDTLINARFQKEQKEDEEKLWRAHHSPRFLTKAQELTQLLRFPMELFLFKS